MIAAPTVILSHALPPADSPEMLAALAALPLACVRRWLQDSVAQHTLTTAAAGLALPEEWARAETLGWTSPQGVWPWAALAAQRMHVAPAHDSDHTSPSNHAWAFIRLCHWQVGNGQFTLLDPGPITQQESDALLASMRPYFEEDGITLHPHRPGCWLANSALLDGLASASAARVMGLPVEPWLLGAQLPELPPAIRTLRRLQNEMQMLLYQHPVNDTRRTAINSIWVEGCGAFSSDCPAPLAGTTAVVLLDDLREPWLLRDAAAWARAWEHLDAEVLPAWLQPPGARIAWCGQRQARWWVHQPPSLWLRLRRLVRPSPLSEVLSCDA